MADADAAMALALADGRALLTIENRDLGTTIVEHVVVDWPDVSVLPEKGRPNGLRKRRGRLRAANLLVDGTRLALLAEGTPLTGGLTRIALTFEKGRLVVSGSVSAAGRDADFKGRVRLGPGVYQYRYFVDGEWQPDPSNPRRVEGPAGGVNSVLIIS